MSNLQLKIIGIFIAILFGIIPIIFLYLEFRNTALVPNGFFRKFRSENPIIRNEIDLGFSGYYFAGNYKDDIFLGHRKATAHLLNIDISNKDISQINFMIPVVEYPGLNPEKIIVDIQFPYAYFIEGSSGILIIGDMRSKKIITSKTYSWRFDNYIQFNPQQFAFRTFNIEKDQNILVLSDTSGNSLNKYIPEKQLDGIFSIDGKLIQSSNQIIYMFYYKNKFLVLNNQLKLKYNGNTIDTITQPQLEIIKTKTKQTMSSPPQRVNKNIFTDSDNLYIESAIKGDNQTLATFQKFSTIDQYNLSTGIYISSFYLPKLNNKRAVEYYFYKNKILAIYDQRLIVFEP